MNEFSVDRLQNVNAGDVAKACMGVVDSLQHQRKETQLAGLAVTFSLACERFGVEPRQALHIAENIMHDRIGRRAEFRACADYMRNEW